MPELEVIRRHPVRRQRQAPLLFVHGAYGGAWCWDEYFLSYFAEQGFDCHAVSLRGHGASGGREMLPFASLDDYVEDVADVAVGLDQAPVVIGHSMGGAVAQRYVGVHPAAGLALVASVPPQGLWDSAVNLWWRNPALFGALALVQAGQEQLASLDRLRAALFAPDMPKEKARQYLARMQAESDRALFDLSCMHLYARPSVLDVPLLVVGGEADGLFASEMVETTAHWYGSEAVILPNLGHTMMLDEHWQDAARCILQWLEGRVPEVPAGSKRAG